MKLPEKLGKVPIVEALFDLRFVPTKAFDSFLPI
jgi:hypothetical protein